MKTTFDHGETHVAQSVAAFCACACVFAVSACGADETGKIRIGIKFDQPGLGFKKSGTYVASTWTWPSTWPRKLGYSEDEIVWKESPSKQREAMLQNGDVDYIVASYSITDERKKVVGFRRPVLRGRTGSAGTQGRNRH